MEHLVYARQSVFQTNLQTFLDKSFLFNCEIRYDLIKIVKVKVYTFKQKLFGYKNPSSAARTRNLCYINQAKKKKTINNLIKKNKLKVFPKVVKKL